MSFKFVLTGVLLCFSFIVEVLGIECQFSENHNTCVSIYCTSFVLVKTDDTLPPTCSFQGKVPKICCSDCPNENTTKLDYLVLNTKLDSGWKKDSKAWNACLEYIIKLPYLLNNVSQDQLRSFDEASTCEKLQPNSRSAAIGNDARGADHPFMAILGYGSDVESADWLCGGTLISEKYILTAAHCISSPTYGPVKYIALGVWKRSKPTKQKQVHNVKRIIPHPEYKSPSKYHDIALLETMNPVPLIPGALPACLDTGASKFYEDKVWWAFGWGSKGPGKERADILQLAYLHKYSDGECAALYKPNRLLKHGHNSTTQFCFGNRRKPADTCQGDSGGPLITYGHVHSYQRTVVGVTSYGRQCGSPGAGMYTRVSYYVPWIESIVWP